ncbi:CAP domain-containing protein [Blakeslea trispora]|nr:CAP domain-containing protein [Blakeslea trispora]
MLRFLCLFIIFNLVLHVSAMSGASINAVLKSHNRYRRKHHASPLHWDDELARFAQKWSNRCEFEHSHGDYGENIAAGYETWSDAIDAWYDEVKYYNYKQTGFDEETGHFTQLVWKSTDKIGCGVRFCKDLWGGVKLYTCSYSSYGNIVGGNNYYFKKNVLAP